MAQFCLFFCQHFLLLSLLFLFFYSFSCFPVKCFSNFFLVLAFLLHWFVPFTVNGTVLFLFCQLLLLLFSLLHLFHYSFSLVFLSNDAFISVLFFFSIIFCSRHVNGTVLSLFCQIYLSVICCSCLSTVLSFSMSYLFLPMCRFSLVFFHFLCLSCFVHSLSF